MTPGQALDALYGLQAQGTNVFQQSEWWAFESAPHAGTVEGVTPMLSDKDGWHRGGFLGDSHLCSKYARLDCLKETYHRFEDAGIVHVFDTGNWIDGEFSENRHDLLVHGMDPQLRYLIHERPSVPGLTTYAVAGNDHEGWYGKREGIDIGRHLEMMMHEAGRTDWVHLGHMEAFVPFQHATSGKQAMVHVMHPGGGSAYAVSYTIQQIVNGYEGGDKPALLLAGHYHKMDFLPVRNVFTVQTACLQDQTPWARQKKLRFELGAGIFEFQQDETTGAILRCKVEFFQYFNRGFYTNNRWNHGGEVTQVPRVSA